MSNYCLTDAQQAQLEQIAARKMFRAAPDERLAHTIDWVLGEFSESTDAQREQVKANRWHAFEDLVRDNATQAALLRGELTLSAAWAAYRWGFGAGWNLYQFRHFLAPICYRPTGLSLDLFRNHPQAAKRVEQALSEFEAEQGTSEPELLPLVGIRKRRP